MNRLPVFFIGVFLTFSSAWLGLVIYPKIHLGDLRPATNADPANPVPPPLSPLAMAGQRVYAANGCVYCHSQQVRPEWLSTDIEKGLGPRRTVARDYIRDNPVFLGTMRTGPDLTNVGLRYDENWQMRHLYEPATVVPGSIMPSFRYLFRVQPIEGAPSPDAIQGLRGPHAPAEGYEVVPTQEVRELVAYLLSLKHNYPLPEAPDDSH